MVVTSLLSLLSGLMSPPPVTLTELLTDGGASGETSTVSVIGGELLKGPSAALVTQATAPPVMVHVQPVPLAAVVITLVRTRSIAMTEPLVGAPPLLLTVMI